jgi:tetratricopeptide (TPR) repeat protein
MKAKFTPESWQSDCATAWLQMRQEMAVWNYSEAVALAAEVEAALQTGGLVEGILAPGIVVLLARAHVNRAETTPGNAVRHIQKAKELISQVRGMLRGNSERLAEVTALQASLAGLEEGSDAGLALLAGRTDHYAIRTRTALLLNHQKVAEAMAVIGGLEPHEWWCDVAVKAYALNDQFEKAQELVQWAAGLSDRGRYPQCIVRLAEGLMARALVGHDKCVNIMPQDITSAERDKLELVVQTLHPVLQTITAAGKPTSGLDMAALQIAWQVNHLLQRLAAVTELLGMMMQWTPVPIGVAQGVALGYIAAPADLPDRLRKDHPGDLDAGMLAAAIETGSFGRHVEAFTHAKKLLPLADSNEKKDELFKIFHAIWQIIEGPEVAECEAIADSLAAHNPRLHAVFEASVALRHNEADRAIAILDGQRAEADPSWLQYRANALLQKRQLSEAVDYLLPAVKIVRHADLLLKTGDIAFQAKRYDVAVWCYERLAEIQPQNLSVRGNLAHIYTFVLHDLERAAEQFRALHTAESVNPQHTFNLAICLSQLFRPDESLPLYDELCRQENPPVPAILGRAQLHHSLGRPDAALASLDPFRERLWGEPNFLIAYMTTAHAAGNDAAGHEALMALNQLREQGAVKPEALRMVQQNEALEIFKQSFKQTQDRDQHLHVEMLKGRMPWVWAEQVSKNAIYWGWRTRTQEMGWIGDEPTNRARFCIYSTNGFHARESDGGRRALLPLECPPAGTKVVADVSALITLHRLGLLDAAAEYFGEVLVPAGYLPTVLEDSRQMVLHQRSRQQSAELITKKVNAGRILPLAEGAETPAAMAIADEYSDSVEHRYRLRDLIGPVHQAGLISDTDFADISRLCAKPSAVDEQHPAPGQFKDVMVDLNTLETMANAGLLDAVAGFYRLRITAGAHLEVIQRLDAVAYQEETRQWHMDLWHRLRGNARFKFLPHTVPEAMRGEDRDDKDYLPFLACFIAQETKTPLLADDRVCQAFTLNELTTVPHAAFGSDVVALALMAASKLEAGKAAAVISQLMAWRYRFIVPPPEVLKLLADQYRVFPPGQSLQRVAEYVHDCMRDTGLFGGPENTEMKDSMAMRIYLTWVSAIAEFLVLVWADEGFTPECATRLTEWSCRELLPSCPRVVDGQMKVRVSEMTPRLFLSHALIKTANHYGEPRMAECMKAMQQALRLSDDEYIRTVTEILHAMPAT